MTGRQQEHLLPASPSSPNGTVTPEAEAAGPDRRA